MKTLQKIKSIFISAVLLCTTTCYAGNAVVASGEASEDMAEAVMHLASASMNLSGAGIYLSRDVAITLGETVSETVLNAAEISGDAVVFSTAVLAGGLITTAQLSAELTQAGIHLSADSAALAAQAASAGIHISVDTAELFLTQAVNIAAASGRLSGEVAELAVILAAAGVELSADSTILIANAAHAGVHLSEEAAHRFINASLNIATHCIESAVITERYIVMTASQANTLLREASIASVKAAHEAGQTVYTFTAQTAGHLQSLGIDAAKYAKELSERAAQTTATAFINTVKSADDAIVVVINTGSGLIVASLDSLTAAVEETSNSLK